LSIILATPPLHESTLKANISRDETNTKFSVIIEKDATESKLKYISVLH
jgi:hypothetical protein